MKHSYWKTLLQRIKCTQNGLKSIKANWCQNYCPYPLRSYDGFECLEQHSNNFFLSHFHSHSFTIFFIYEIEFYLLNTKRQNHGRLWIYLISYPPCIEIIRNFFKILVSALSLTMKRESLMDCARSLEWK